MELIVEPVATTHRAGPLVAKRGEYLAFRIGTQEYGIDILRVLEIRSYEPPARIANTSQFIRGVVNLRGVIVPIVDLHLKLDGAPASHDSPAVVVVLDVRSRVVGALVDSVSDRLALGPGQIQPAPEPGSSFDSRFITGIGTVKSRDADRKLILLDIEALMGSAEIGLAG